MLPQSVHDRTRKECTNLRCLLTQKYKGAYFRVIHHFDIPSDENVIIKKKLQKRSGDARRISINYVSKQVDHKDLLAYLGDCGYGNFAYSRSHDGFSGDGDVYDARLVGYIHPEANSLAKYL